MSTSKYFDFDSFLPDIIWRTPVYLLLTLIWFFVLSRFALEIPSVEKINHLVIFLVGDPFPEGFAATVHILLPNSPWQLLGQLSNDKPSAIFRLSGIKHSSTEDMSMDDDNTVGSTATLGISIEPIGE
ncbi:hypothetical protein BKA69DRAFT_1076597 [Paraphysoderma sedebokerense]|nr:hypothetical protein BKA69DRAFT_1076597 [Paraphysoderma sedebokerense]